MKHRTKNELLGKYRIEFEATYEHLSGTRVLIATTLEVHDGEILPQMSVEAWSE